MNSASLALLALTAAAPFRGPELRESASTSQEAGTSTGRAVAEIDPRIWVVRQVRNGDYWFGSNGNGVYRYDGRRVTQFTDADGLSGLQVRDIQDHVGGHVLVSTNGGISRFDGERFADVEITDPLSGEEGGELSPDDAWIVFHGGASWPARYDGEKLHRLALPESPAADVFRGRVPDAGFSPSGVYSIYEDRRGHLWFGTAAAGLCRYDGRSFSWMYEEALTTTPSGGEFGIRSIYEDRAGDFWICNTRQRFAIAPEPRRVDGADLLQYEKKEGLPGARADTDPNFAFYASMTEDPEGALWMACGSRGVWRYDGEVVTRYPVGDGAYVLSIHCDRDGNLWVGSLEHGIHRFDGERFQPFEVPEPGR